MKTSLYELENSGDALKLTLDDSVMAPDRGNQSESGLPDPIRNLTLNCQANTKLRERLVSTTWTEKARKLVDTADVGLKPENTILNISGQPDFVKCLQIKNSKLTLCKKNESNCDQFQVVEGPDGTIPGFLMVNVTENVKHDVTITVNATRDVTSWTVSCKFGNGFAVFGEALPVKKEKPVFEKVSISSSSFWCWTH